MARRRSHEQARLALFLALVAVLSPANGCNLVAGITEPTRTTSTGGTGATAGSGGGAGASVGGGGTSTAVPCSTDADCPVDEPKCRSASCTEGECQFTDALSGEPLSPDRQTPSDCLVLVCDGHGGTRLDPSPGDSVDDNNPCTDDECKDGAPVHLLRDSIPCYTGALGTEGKGLCKGGTAACTELGPSGDCEGQVVPVNETCLLDTDEDCDGDVNEEGDGCVCVPGSETTCYPGPDGTEGVSICHGGMQTCLPDGTGYGPCMDARGPMPEDCDAAGVDEDCDGQVNESGPSCACGDGVVNNNETCDDGNDDDTDACPTNCKIATCGDGFLQAGVEQCDDGNQSDADACLNTCVTAKCGDGVLRAGVEQCDDGNQSNTDACLNTCQPATCGDGYVRAGFEQCDDGNAINTDACPTTCLVAKCGDGFVRAGVEECDDANAINTDACLNTCVTAKCGDGLVRAGVESCDDGNQSNTDACLNSCVTAACGDGYIRAGVEQCDDGNQSNTDACVACQTAKCGDGFVQAGVEACDDGNVNDQDACPASCKNDACGDGVWQSAVEQCDDGNAINSDACLNTCFTAKCGDGFVRAGVEQCDDGATADGDKCSPTCQDQYVVQVTGRKLGGCARLNDGRVKCWGDNNYGQLGLGDTVPRGYGANQMGSSLPSLNLGTGKTAVQIAGTSYYNCALLSNSTLKCWGNNSYGQLGQGSTSAIGDQPGEMGDALSPIDLGSGWTPSWVAAGNSHACALSSAGLIKCWGSNYECQLGRGASGGPYGDGPGEMGNNLPAVNLGTGMSAAQVTAGASHTCAVLTSGNVKCWGYNNYGQLGLDSPSTFFGCGAGTIGDNLPVVNLGGAAVAVSAGAAHTCALLQNGSVKCWGRNDYGQLGQDHTNAIGSQAGQMAALGPVNLGPGRTAVQISTGERHTCALLDDGTVKCWGYNGYGQLGQGHTNPIGSGVLLMSSLAPVDLGAGKTATQLSAGGDQTCAVLNDGSVKCWGQGTNGALGQGNSLTLGDQPNEMGANLPTVKLFSNLW